MSKSIIQMPRKWIAWVYCPLKRVPVPHWFCLGSYVRRRSVCPHLKKAEWKVKEGKLRVICEKK